MATRSRGQVGVQRAIFGFEAAARILWISFGCAAAGWGLSTLPVFWQQSPTDRIASRIIAGDPFNPELLSQTIPIVQAAEFATRCRPSGVRSAAIIRLRIVETGSMTMKDADVAREISGLRDTIQHSLSCAPADPFLWLALYWVVTALDGFKVDHLVYLKLSYELGRNEGWIALNRSRIALDIFEQLSPDLAEAATSEFVGLVGNGFYEDAVDILANSAWRLRERLVPRLSALPLRRREAFARALSSHGYDVVVPGASRAGTQGRN